MLAKSMQKHAGRAKEKILQNLGKVDRTADDIFDDHLNNFNRQQASATRLQKEFSNYIRCIRAVQVASKSLMDAVGEIYEPQWTGYDALQAQSAASESLWQDFSHKLADQVLIPLNTYTGQFPEMKKKIEKRNRKLIDYDGQRHSFQSLQASANKRKDDVKGREQLEDARRTYEILNTELHDELPALYDSRILFLVTNLQTLFATENIFHSETAKIYSELEAIVDKLATDSQRGSNTLRKQTSEFIETNAIKSSSPVLASPLKQMNSSNMNNSNYQNQITTNGSSNANSPTTTSSSSQQESRLDSVSSTPESTPENHRSATPTTTPTPISPARAKSLTATTTAASAAALAATTTTTNVGASTDELSLVKDVINKEEEENCEEQNNNNNVDEHENGKDADNNITKITTTSTTSNNLNDVKSIEKTTTTTTKEKTPKGTKEITEIVTEKLNGNATNGNIDQMEKHASKINAAVASEELSATTVLTTAVSDIEANNGNVVDNKKSLGETNTNSRNVKGRKLESKNPFEDDERIYEVPDDATTADLPPGVLYRVKATYGYVKEDVDELSFEIGDIIRVIEYDDPEDQEEGWLMGQKEGTNDKGLFPANFTKPI